MVPDVVTIGDINIDIITDPLTVDLVKDKEKEIITKFLLSLGGNTGNSAVALSQLGLNTRLIGALSDDPISKWLIEILENNKVDFRNCFKEKSSAITFSVTYTDGTRTFISDLGSNYLLSFEDIDLDLIEGKHLHRAGYWWAPKLMGSGTKQLFQVAREKGLSTSLDIGWDPEGWTQKRRENLYDCLEVCDILFLNNKELEALTQSDLDKGAKLLLERGVQLIGLHYGEKGCKIYTKTNSVLIPIYHVHISNPTGTGDIFNAAFIYGYLQQWDLDQIGKFANASAAVHLSNRQTPYPTLQEIQNFLKSSQI
ncbi:MAG TPA: carbohydrate kinase family protein [Candidatus Deferrimicrobium sp.]|nr:carbohydrate kinase family protein [Candidatus Deferrimicrobium sp.]